MTTSKLQDAIDKGSELGICHLLKWDQRLGHVAYDVVISTAKELGYYSGCDGYVIDPGDGRSAFEAYYSDLNKFNPDTEYGRRRIEIAKLIIERHYK